jgi:hypothetical protein
MQTTLISYVLLHSGAGASSAAAAPVGLRSVHYHLSDVLQWNRFARCARTVWSHRSGSGGDDDYNIVAVRVVCAYR